MTTVMAFGTFDGVHKGHEYYLRKAKESGDYLVVVVARDATVNDVKGKMPSYSEQQRLQQVMGLDVADKAIIGNSCDKLKVVEEFRPDVICLGYDQMAFTDSIKENLQKRGLNPRILRLDSFKPEVYKSSLIKQRSH